MSTTKGRPPATMRDIAAVAEVSQSTVSRVLSGAPTSVPIAPETRARVIRRRASSATGRTRWPAG